MAVDKLVDSSQLNSDLTSVANAIRTKGGTSAQLAFPSGFVSAVEAIPTGGGGGSQLTKLSEINVTQNVRSVAITPSSDWFNYDYLVIKYELTFSSSDYLYFSKTDSSGGVYTNSRANYNAIGSVLRDSVNSKFVFYEETVNGRNILENGETLYAYMYSANKTIQSGSKITVYGGMYNDL